MSYKSIILFALFILNLYLATAVFLRNRKSPVNFYYSLMVLAGSFWNLGLFGYSLTLTKYMPDIRLLFTEILYICTLITSFYYFIFAYHFPYRTFTLPKPVLFILYIFVFLYSLILSVKIDYLFDINILNTNVEITNLGNYLTFSIIFGLFVLAGFITLLVKYFKVEGVFKIQIRYVLIGTVLTYLLASLTNLIPSFWNSYSTYWIGPIFTLINASAIAYLIFKKNR